MSTASKKQYRLETPGEPVVVADLGVTVTRHEAVWISRSDLEASDCLRVLIRLGKVRVSSGERVRVSKEPPKKRLPTFVARSRPHGKGVPTPPPKQEAPTGITPEEAQAMADKAAQKAAEDAAKMAVAALLPAIHAIQQNPEATGDLDSRIEQAVARALGNVSFAAPSGAAPINDPTPTGPDEPMFIPKGIVKDDAESLTVKSDSTQSGGLDDAASALKALRKGKGGGKK